MDTTKSGNAANPLDLLTFNGAKRVPLILQSEASECGLACLAMVSSFYGQKVNLSSLRKHVVVGSQGMNLKQLMSVSGAINLSSRALQCDLEEIKLLKLPCILHWNLDHFVVLTGVSKKWLSINDPERGKRKISLQEFSECFTGIALELTPASKFKKQDTRVVMKISQLWSKMTGLKSSLISLFFVSIVIQASQLISPYYLQWVIDNVLLSNDKPLLQVMALGFGLLALIQVVVKCVRSWLIIRLNCAINIQMGANLFHHLVRLPLDYFEKRHIGDVVSRFGSLNTIREFLTQGIIESLIDGLMAIVVLVMMYVYSPSLTFLVIGFVFLSFVIQMAFYYPNRRVTEESIVAGAKEDSIFLETIRGIQTIKLFSHETARQNTWLNRYAEVINTDIRLGKLSIAEESLENSLNSLELILVIYFGALIVMEEQLSVGMLIAFLAYRSQFTSSIFSLIDKLITFKLIGLHLERLSDITFEETENDDGSVILPHSVQGYIKVSNLWFRYSDNTDWILKDISFEIAPGESVAIVGPSGCGKTTLLKLILGLLKPNSGSIYIDNVNINEVSVTSYRGILGSVMQNDSLFSGTLTENITMFDVDNFQEEKMVRCCKTACIWDEINQLPMGFHTQVGDMGSSFSGGQLQRIFLARALYKEPKVLCLDESTSHLDSDNEKTINVNINQLKITKIVIAHRKETIRSANRVINLNPNSMTQAEEYFNQPTNSDTG
ncbi:peptidase domain-containing ABC transporter [Vibrio sp. Hep-1b-8]|uniref:peptidase domain-containing ABC transporter n=1 Tax=Vibrio sp. Hep-1b-8 TaxID=2144187 RepID=UPI0011104F28|nr:peptidase domain-containing ABC transporter [Vibrio sp. Hep-1b-8]TMX46409.1 ABC transporter ATP-binding protein [Vibrio sp. Hep-1b-8]